jgi:hypothetical protein
MRQAGFAARHFAMLEEMVTEQFDHIKQNTHSMTNISHIGMCIESLGKMMQEWDYLGPIKLGLGHDGEHDILDKIAYIVTTIKNAARLEYYTEESKLDAEEKAKAKWEGKEEPTS